MLRLFCSTVYLFNKTEDKVLLLFHKKLQMWAPPGGKLDPNELPDDAARRECFEETGIEVELIGDRSPVDDRLMKPYGMQVYVITPNEKEHIDFMFQARPKHSEQFTINEQESSDIKWFSLDEALSPNFKTSESIKGWIRYFDSWNKKRKAITKKSEHVSYL